MQPSRHILYSILLGIISLVAFGSCDNRRELTPKEWYPDYYNTSTLPYGTFIADRLLDSVFTDRVIRSRENPKSYIYELDIYIDEYYDKETQGFINPRIISKYSYLNNRYLDVKLEEDEKMHSYLFVLPHFHKNEDLEKEIFDFVGVGNHVFISAERFSFTLLKELSISGETTYIINDSVHYLKDNPDKKYNFPPHAHRNMDIRTDFTTYFNITKATLPIEVLGTNGKDRPTFIKVKYGYGYFYLNTVPRAFANISMVDLENYDYAYRCLSYLPQDSQAIWDEYLKQGEIGSNERSMFEIIYKSEALVLGFIILLMALLLYMIFRGKRTQRVIPIVEPIENMSEAFLNNISNMYYKKHDYRASIERRQIFFLDYIRKNYFMNTELTDEKFYQVLSAKSTVSDEVIKSVFGYYKQASSGHPPTIDTFINYNRCLETFYKTVKNK